MKHFILLIFLIIFPVRIYSQGNYKKIYKEAITHWVYKEYDKAKKNFVDLYSDPDLAMYQDTIAEWIKACDKRIAIIKEANDKANKAKIEKIKNDKYFYISVLTSNYDDSNKSTYSAISNVLKLNNEKTCSKIDNALSLVTVFYEIKEESEKNGFYKANGSGNINLGNAFDIKYDSWSVDCEATSAVSMNDAKRLVRNKLNDKLCNALDKLLNNIPIEANTIIPSNSLAIWLSCDTNEEITTESLRVFIQELRKIIVNSPDYIYNNVLDEANNADLDRISTIMSDFVERDQRAPIHELDGFKQYLELKVNKDSEGQYIFEGTIKNLKGNSIKTANVDGDEFIFKDLSSHNQKLAASIIATGLGLKEWKIGENIGEYKLAEYNGLHGCLIRKIDDNYIMMKGFHIDQFLPSLNLPPKETLGMRLPYASELIRWGQFKRELNLTTIYWTSDVPEKKMHIAVDFRNPTEEAMAKTFKDKEKAAALLIVKEF